MRGPAVAGVWWCVSVRRVIGAGMQKVPCSCCCRGVWPGFRRLRHGCKVTVRVCRCDPFCHGASSFVTDEVASGVLFCMHVLNS